MSVGRRRLLGTAPALGLALACVIAVGAHGRQGSAETTSAGSPGKVLEAPRTAEAADTAATPDTTGFPAVVAAPDTAAATGAAAAPAAAQADTTAASDTTAARGPQAIIETTLGAIRIQLDPARAPITVENFVRYAQDGFYAGTLFHRVIPGYLIQGGGLTTMMSPKPTGPPIALETPNGLAHERGTVAMARWSTPTSATSQFFINLRDNTALDYPGVDGYGYAVFGKVVDGMETVDRIAATPTAPYEVKGASGVTLGVHPHAPVEPVVILNVRIIP